MLWSTHRACGPSLRKALFALFFTTLPATGAAATPAGGGQLPPIPPVAAPGEETVSAAAPVYRKRLTYHPDAYRPAKDDYMPTGTVKKRYHLVLSGDHPGFHHTEYHLPNTQFDMFKERYFGKNIYLPGGRVAMADGIGSRTDQNFGFWRENFIHLSGAVPEQKDSVSLLGPVLCVATATHHGDGWAAAEWHLRRFLGGAHGTPKTVTTTVRVKRVVGDPFLYVLIRVPEDEATARGVSLLSINRGDPSHLWFGGRDHLVKECKGQVHLIDSDAKAGGIWYNSETNQNRGCSAVFLPEEVAASKAWGGHDGSLVLTLKGNFIRLALDEWNQPRGWKAQVAPFVDGLAERVQRLRAMDFSCPLKATNEGGAARRVERLLAALPRLYRSAEDQEMLAELDALTEGDEADSDLLGDGSAEDEGASWAEADTGPPDPKALRERVEALQGELARAQAALARIPRATTPERIDAEQAVVRLTYAIDQALEPALRDWLKRGGLFAEEQP